MINVLNQAPKKFHIKKNKDWNISDFIYFAPLSSFADFLCALFCLIVFVRSSFLIFIYPVLNKYFFYGTYVLFIFTLVWFILGNCKKNVNILGIFIFVSIFLSCCFSPVRSQALFKGVGWLILFSTLGPFISDRNLVRFRASAWIWCRFLMLFVGVFSAFWYFLRLPNFGVGLFTGVMSFSMMTAPLAAMACLLALFQALNNKSLGWGLVSLLCLVTTLVSGSRIALLSLFAGLFVILFMGKYFRVLILFIIPLLIIYFLASAKVEMIMSEMTTTMRDKGSVNTRETLWRSRLNEFQTYPFFGMGVGIGEGGEEAGVMTKEGNINIEPGSSYLAILSMTGLFGALAFLLLFLNMIYLYFKNNSHICMSDQVELLSIIMFFLVHMIAEGWILAVGSLLAVIFWLSLGRLYDLSANKVYC